MNATRALRVGVLRVGVRRVGVLLLAAACALTACKKGDAPSASGASGASGAKGADDPPAAKADFHGALRAAFGKAGLEVGAFADADPKAYAATRCARGPVAKLEVLVCEYASAEAAKAAESKLASVVGGAVTGAVRQRGTLALVVVDRDKVDLGGKSINKLLGTFLASGS